MKKVYIHSKKICLQRKRICSHRKMVCLDTQDKSTANCQGKQLRQIFATNSHRKKPRQIPMAKSHGKQLQQIKFSPNQFPVLSYKWGTLSFLKPSASNFQASWSASNQLRRYNQQSGRSSSKEISKSFYFDLLVY